MNAVLLKFEKTLFYFLIFCLPFQIRKILWQPAAPFSEWATIFLYATDILIGLILISWILRTGLRKVKTDRILLLSVFCLAIITLLSLLKAANFHIGLYQWLKLLEFIFLFFYVRENFKVIYHLKRIFQILIASAVFQSIIAIFQFAKQSSLGLKLLGESPLGPNLDGVAKFLVDGVKIIRSYATFPHPNILACFLILALFGLIYFWSQKKPITFSLLTTHCSLLGLLLLALFLTFSRVIIVVGLLAVFLYLIFVVRKKGLTFLFIGCCLLLVALLWPMVSVRFSTELIGSQAMNLRVFYNKAALQMLKSSPLIGIGWGNFTHYSLLITHNLELWAYQPVHNIYLLVASQAGLLGLLGFLGLLGVIIKKSKNLLLLFALIFFLIIGLFDHFVLTSQQGQLMLWLVLGMITSYHKDKHP